MSEKLSMNNKKRSRINQKEQEEESYPKTINFPARSLCPPPPSKVNFRKRGSKLSLPLSHRLQNPSCTLERSEVYKGRCTFSFRHPPPPSPPHTHTHTHTRQNPDTPLSGIQVYRKGYICYHPANDSRSGHKFPKTLWCCVGGGYNKIIWFC